MAEQQRGRRVNASLIMAIGVALVGTGLLGIVAGSVLVSRGIHRAIDPPVG